MITVVFAGPATITVRAGPIYRRILMPPPGKNALEPLARGERGGKVEAVDDGEAETARRHRMALRRNIVVEGDLHGTDAGDAPDRSISAAADGDNAGRSAQTARRYSRHGDPRRRTPRACLVSRTIASTQPAP